MADHLAAYLVVLRNKRRADMYVYNVDRHITTLIADCGWKLPRDVTADSFEAWRSGRALKGKTLNDYLADAKGLLTWMQRGGRLNANPLASVSKVDTSGEETERRALSDDELARLLGVAGPRRAAYLTAAFTGLRRNELALLQWGDVHLDVPKPFLKARGSTTENGKPATLWLVPEVVAELRAARPADATDATPVFGKRGVPPMDEFRADLAAAKIGETDARGRVVVFHSLRHTLNTDLGRSGAAVVVAMQVMRHSDSRLTLKRYTDASQLPTSEAMERLPRPRLNGTPGESQTAVATGTDGRARDAQKDAQPPVPPGPRLSHAVTQGFRVEMAQPLADQGVSLAPSAAVTSGLGEGEMRHLGLEPRTR